MSMYSASQLVWISAGSPQPERGKGAIGSHGRCAICGGIDKRGIPLVVACPKASFSGHQDMRWIESGLACTACTWSMEGKPPNTLRMWTILYREDCDTALSAPSAPDCGRNVHLANKGNLDAVADALLHPPKGPWCCSITNSGKIHILPYTPVNNGEDSRRWSIRIERENVLGSEQGFGNVLHHVAALVQAGYHKSHISSRNPHPSALVKHGIENWKTNINQLPIFGNTPLERLALMIIRKENADEWFRRTKYYRR